MAETQAQPRIVGINPSAFAEDNPGSRTLAEFLEQVGKPIKKSALEIHSLDIHCVDGISSVKEALTTWSNENDIGYQELSRLACAVVACRMTECPEVASLSESWSQYWRAAKLQSQEIRRAAGKPLAGLPPLPPSSSVSCLPSACPAACACG